MFAIGAPAAVLSGKLVAGLRYGLGAVFGMLLIAADAGYPSGAPRLAGLI